MTRKLVALSLALVMVVGLMAGCSSSSSTPSASPSSASSSPAASAKTTTAKDMTFVIVPKCVHAWFDEVNKGAVKEAKALEDQLGVTVTINYMAPESADIVSQNAVLEQAAATHPNAIALDPVDLEGSRSIISEIQNMGIAVILFDGIDSTGALTYVGNNFAEQASLASEKLAELVNFEGKVAVMQGYPSASNHAERYQSHLKTLAQYPNIKVIEGGIDNDNVQTAQSQAAATMAANPDLVGYTNCDACGSGVAAAIEEAGKAGKITFVAMDNLIEILQYVKKGTITATSSTLPQSQGMLAVLVMYQATLGLDLPSGLVDTGIGWIDSSNIDEWIKIVSGS